MNIITSDGITNIEFCKKHIYVKAICKYHSNILVVDDYFIRYLINYCSGFSGFFPEFFEIFGQNSLGQDSLEISSLGASFNNSEIVLFLISCSNSSNPIS